MKTKIALSTALVMLCALTVIGASGLRIAPPKKNVRVKITYSLSVLQRNLEYDFSRSTIRKNYNDRLDQLAEIINEKKCAVALRGYADSIGTYKGNWVLSQKRADNVKKYLITKGVPSELIVSTAFGSTQPISSNKTAEGRQQNRRVEIKIKEINN